MRESDDNKSTRHRSPNYPGFSLRVAVARINSWYQQDGWVASNRDAALAHMGFERFSGDAGRLLSALKNYGLIQDVDGRVKLTQRAVDIVARELDDPKRTLALQSAGLGPLIYRELLKQFPGGKVLNGTLKSELIATKKFNPKSVDDFIRDFRATIDFAGLSSLESIGVDEPEQPEAKDQARELRVGDFVQWTCQGVWQFQEPQRITGFTQDHDFAYVEASKTAIPVGQLTVEAPPSRPATQSMNGPQQVMEQAPPVQRPTGRLLLTHDLVVSIPRNFRLAIEVRGDELKREDISKIKSQFNRWIEGLEEAFE